MDNLTPDDSGMHHLGVYVGQDRRTHSVPVAVDLRKKPPSIWEKLWELISVSDTTPTKFLLATSATLWCALLLLPGDSLQRPIYFYLAQLAGERPDEKWAFTWGIFAACEWWNTFTSGHPRRSLFVNAFGMVLYCSIPMAILMQRSYPFPIGAAPYVAIAMASIWVTVRTDINPRKGWRGD